MISILGIDPGFANVGWAIMDVHSRTGHLLPSEKWMKVVCAGRITTEPAKKKLKVGVGDDDHRRTKLIARELNDLIVDYGVSLICMEQMSSVKNQSNRKTAYCVAVVATLCAVNDVPFTQVTPQTMKKMLTGRQKVTDKVLRGSIDKLYPELKPILLSEGVSPCNQQHSYDAVGAIHTTWDDEHFVAVRRLAALR